MPEQFAAIRGTRLRKVRKQETKCSIDSQHGIYRYNDPARDPKTSLVPVVIDSAVMLDSRAALVGSIGVR